MSGRFCSVGKLGIYCEAVTFATEQRKEDGEVKVVQLACRVQPFDAKLASAIAPVVRADLFRLGNAEPKPEVHGMDFALGIVRQSLQVFATPDTVQASIALDHVKIANIKARSDAKARGYVFTFKMIFGPYSSRELEYVADWRCQQRFVTFEPAQASAAFEEVEPPAPEPDDQQDLGLGAGEDLRPGTIAEFGDQATKPAADDNAARQTLHSHAPGKKKRGTPEVH